MTHTCWARRGWIAAVFLVMAMAPASAQQPSPAALALAKEIFALKDATKIYDPVVPGVVENVRQLLLQRNPMVGKDLNEVAAKVRADMGARREEVQAIVYKLYASRFTEAELKELVAFYRTPLGKKVLAEEPRILEESLNEVDAWANRFSEEVIIKVREEMRKRGHDL